MACCPEGAWGYQKEDYAHKGKIQDLDGLNVYHHGSDKPKNCIIIFFDIFGFCSGRIKGVCDYFAEQGYFVVMPDFFRGGGHEPGSYDFIGTVNKYPIEGIQKDLDNTMDWCRSQGAEKFSYIGFCYGTWVAFKTITDKFFCGVNYHPSNQLEAFLGGDDEGLVKNVKANMLFVPAKEDKDYTREGGSYLKDLHERGFSDSYSVDYPDMNHGFVVRGDMKDENVAKRVIEALEEGRKFLAAQYAK